LVLDTPQQSNFARYLEDRSSRPLAKKHQACKPNLHAVSVLADDKKAGGQSGSRL
jgi:hypothetical protein